ncbi:HlyD family secretion protein [bacterium SCSIO 12643]|nr:HlyD family secretion protein [bacterium SCSIO 12643]
MNKRNILIGVGVLIFGVLSFLVVKKSKESNAKYTVTSTEIVKGKIVETVSATGRIQPEREVKISPEVPGEIIELPVVEGMKVSTGDLLVKINPDLYLASVSRAQAGLNSAKANMANSRARLTQSKARFINADENYKRQLQLNKDGVVSDSDFDRVKSEFEVAKAEVSAAEESVKAAEFNVKSAQATVKEANDNLKRTTIYAPMNGTVSKLNVELGERVVGTAQMAGTELMRVADLTQMEVHVEVNESDIVRVKVGDQATVEVDAYLNRKFTGVVKEIANSSASSNIQSTNEITVFNVEISIDRASYEDLIDPKNPHLSPFRPGMSANVEILTNERDNIVMVPIQSVTIRPDSSENVMRTVKINLEEYEDDELFEVIFVLEDGEAVMKKVKTGIQDTKNIEIVEGVSEGETVISGPYSIVSNKLLHGDKVEIKSKEDLYKSDSDEK